MGKGKIFPKYSTFGRLIFVFKIFVLFPLHWGDNKLSYIYIYVHTYQLVYFVSAPKLPPSFANTSLCYIALSFGNSNSLLCLTALLIGNKHFVFLGLLSTLEQRQWRGRATPIAVAQIPIHAKSLSAAFASPTSTRHAKHSPTGAGPTSADSLNAFNRQSGYF